MFDRQFDMDDYLDGVEHKMHAPKAKEFKTIIAGWINLCKLEIINTNRGGNIQ